MAAPVEDNSREISTYVRLLRKRCAFPFWYSCITKAPAGGACFYILVRVVVDLLDFCNAKVEKTAKKMVKLCISGAVLA